ncbi:MAG: DeoR/GlpR family DNA-binding transcription regulator [Peptostreptococcaceae bacterium]|jgi:DeoR family fructose operon transcriptional repressor|nr:DeoR/GlpR family DNA-binding transcription regulator [Peptostreptococcaceae bacterium]
MLTQERQELILQKLQEEKTIKISEIVEITNSSESTIRRDLTQLEKESKLRRIHGGATLIDSKIEELSFNEKMVFNKEQKIKIAKYAASLIKDGDCIYLDAGTTTFEMIQYINSKNIVIVTNGLKHIDAIVEKDIEAYIIGGFVKNSTKAVIGINALKDLKNYRFDKVFLGMNGIDLKNGFTTPDSNEAYLKKLAMDLGLETYVLADKSKFNRTTFVKVADLYEATIILDEEVFNMDKYLNETNIKVVIK